MEKIKTVKTISKSKLIVLISGFSIIIATIGALLYINEITTTRTEAENELRSIAELKIEQLINWKNERILDIKLTTHSSFFVSAVESLLKDKSNANLNENIKKYISTKKNYGGYANVLIASTDGEPLNVTENTFFMFDPLVKEKVAESQKNKSIEFTDFYYNQNDKTISYDIIAPLINDSNQVIASLILRINPYDFLYPYIQNWLPGYSTYETLLIRKEKDSIVFLNELKFMRNSALNFKISISETNVPAVQAVLGHYGFYDGLDYRGHKVLSYVSPIKGTGWFIVAKIDKSELFEGLSIKLFGIILITILLIGMIVLILISIFNSRQQNIYKQLYEIQEEFKTTLYSIGDAVITTDKSGKVKYMNSVAEKLTGWTEDEAKNKHVEDIFRIINEDSRKTVENPVERVLKEGLVVGLANHTLLISKDGFEIPIADSGAPIKDETGEIIGVVLVFRDQTEERAIQKAILKQTIYLDNLFTNTPGAVAVLDNDSVVVKINKKFTELFGYEYHEAVGKHLNDLIVPENYTEEADHLCSPNVLKSFEKQEYETIRKHKNGTLIDVAIIGSEIIVEEKKSGVYAIYIDIGERKRIEKEKQLFSKVLEGTINEIYIFDSNTFKFVNVNRGARENLGYSLEELMNLTPLDLKPEFTENKFRELIQPLQTKEKDTIYFETVHKRKDATLYPVEVFLSFRKTEGLFVAIINDITERKKAEELLRQSEALYRTTLYSIGDAVITTDKEGKILQINHVAEELTGWKEEEAKGNSLESVFNIVSEDTHQKFEGPVIKVLREGLIVGLANHTLLLSKDGREIPIADSGAPIKDETGEIIGVVLVFRDQTEERKNQKILNTRLMIVEYAKNHTLNDIFQKTLDEIGELVNSPIGFYHLMLPDQGTLGLQAWSTRTEKEFCKAEGKGLHYSISEAGVWVDCVHQKKPVIHNDYESLPHKKGLPEGHAPVIRELVVPIFRNDKIVAVLGVGNKPTNYNESDLEIVSFLADVLWEVAEKKMAEEKLIESEVHFRTLADSGQALIWTSGTDKLCDYFNQTWLDFTGRTLEQELGNGWAEGVHPDDLDFCVKTYIEAFDKRENFSMTYRLKRYDGEYRWIQDDGTPRFDSKGEFIGYIGHCLDVTERKKAEESVVSSEIRYRRLFESAKDGILILDYETGVIVDVNPFLINLLGYTKEDFLLKSIWDIGIFENIFANKEYFLKLQQEKYVRYEDLPLETHDGKKISVEFVSNVYKVNDNDVIQCNIRDITKRKRRESELYETKDILEKIFFGLRDGIIVIDSKTKNITGCNLAAEKIFGYGKEVMLNQPVKILFKDNDPINFKQVDRTYFAKMSQQENNGDTNPLDLTQKPETGILKRKDNILFPATYMIFPLLDNDNNILRYVAIVRDISEEIRLEQERKLNLQKLKSYAAHLQNVREDERTSIAREIHDEIGQALSVMNMNLTLLERDYLSKKEKFKIDEIKKEIVSMKEFIIKTVGRMRKLIMNLRPEVIEDLNITEAIEWLIDEFIKDNRIECEFIKNVDSIHLSDDKNISLFRIVQESLRNIARHSKATKVAIKLEKITAGYYLEIADNGTGFDINKVDYKKSFGITGLKERASVLDGKIDIDSEIGKGTRIVVSF